MSDDVRPTPSPAPVSSEPGVSSSSDATREVRRALDDAEVGRGDYDIRSHKSEEGIVTVVAVSGWGPPSLTKYVDSALRKLAGATVRRSGREFSITFR